MSSLYQDAPSRQWFSRLAQSLDRRSATRLAILFLGVVLARGRRTVTSWIRAAKLSDQFRHCYTTVSAAGKKADTVAKQLLTDAVLPLVHDAPRITLALDDTPTERFGPRVQGAGTHHNPTPGPAGSLYVFGHVWVVLGILVTHVNWGTIALPLLAKLYIRKKDLPAIQPKHRPTFRTKLEMAAELRDWAAEVLKRLGKPIWIVVDGAYAKAPFLEPAAKLGFTVVSRLRKDAALCSVPKPRPSGQRGRPRIYGDQGINLAMRAGQRRGWQTGTFSLYGEQKTKRYKTFLATWRPAGGLIRVVLVAEEKSWVAFFCTDPDATVADILGAVAARFSLEIAFRDCKEIVGAGQQQVRHIWANFGSFMMCLWTFTMTEAWAWRREQEELVDRSSSPWDVVTRRPSHADKRNAWRRELLQEELRGVLRVGITEEEIQATTERLLRLAA